MEKEAKMQIIIRQETPEDYKEVYELIAEAFASAEHADGNEQDLVVALRKGNSFIGIIFGRCIGRSGCGAYPVHKGKSGK